MRKCTQNLCVEKTTVKEIVGEIFFHVLFLSLPSSITLAYLYLKAISNITQLYLKYNNLLSLI